MDVWVVVLTLEVCSVVLLLALSRRVGRDALDASTAWRHATRRLRPALVALRADAARTRASLDALERRDGAQSRQ